MKLSIAVDQYVARKRIDGYAFSNEESRLARFCKSSGDLDISDLSSDHVVAYLDGSDVATVTWRQMYFLLLRFFEFLHWRKEIPLPFDKPLFHTSIRVKRLAAYWLRRRPVNNRRTA